MAFLFGFLGGLALLLSKAMNNAAATRIGLLQGTLLNYVTGTLVAGLLAMALGGFHPLTTYMEIPWYFFLAGLMGLLAMLISNATLHRLPVIHTTALILVTQMSVALALDYWLFGIGSWLKVAGAAVVIAGLLWDQKYIGHQAVNPE